MFILVSSLSAVVGTTMQDVEDFVACLKDKITILNATVRQRVLFREYVTVNKNLRLVDVGNWAGLGTVQYVSCFTQSLCGLSYNHSLFKQK